MQFWKETTINLGAERQTMQVHGNAPVVVNFSTGTGAGRRYNRNGRKMRYASVGFAAWLCEYLNRVDPTRTWYIANPQEAA